ncbi:ribonuclease H family protein [Thalassoroseus pseudoceratinae]|uniref:hypothetical protein n=1 Tax=Thalassoroseus pseudoceratinae TaxID=2713176 RepID=UPI00142343FD|nr:hypothetical protein [Thalassoroseus pseudoceratinae]
MGIQIGMDEAGYGPNLGPLVVTATVWDSPGDPRACDLWECFAEVASNQFDGQRLHIGDSKEVYSPAKGMTELERSVFAVLGLAYGRFPKSLAELVEIIGGDWNDFTTNEPWYADDLPLPILVDPQALTEHVERWRACCESHGIHCRSIRSDVVLTARWNQLVETVNNKALAHSRNCLALLGETWSCDDGECLIVIDKHGGRNRYDELLAEILDGEMVMRQEEGRHLSRYRVGQTELQFRTKAEAAFPVAVASLVSKYLRETAMVLFNRFWLRHLPDLKPTKGYPQDAKRFRGEIAEMQAELGIDMNTLWRNR